MSSMFPTSYRGVNSKFLKYLINFLVKKSYMTFICLSQRFYCQISFEKCSDIFMADSIQLRYRNIV